MHISLDTHNTPAAQLKQVRIHLQLQRSLKSKSFPLITCTLYSSVLRMGHYHRMAWHNLLNGNCAKIAPFYGQYTRSRSRDISRARLLVRQALKLHGILMDEAFWHIFCRSAYSSYILEQETQLHFSFRFYWSEVSKA